MLKDDFVYMQDECISMLTNSYHTRFSLKDSGNQNVFFVMMNICVVKTKCFIVSLKL